MSSSSGRNLNDRRWNACSYSSNEQMNRKYVVVGLIGLSAIIGYNAFLVQRDAKLLEAYNQPTPQERYCDHLKTWHPDCKVE